MGEIGSRLQGSQSLLFPGNAEQGATDIALANAISVGLYGSEVECRGLPRLVTFLLDKNLLLLSLIVRPRYSTISPN